MIFSEKNSYVLKIEDRKPPRDIFKLYVKTSDQSVVKNHQSHIHIRDLKAQMP